MVLILVALSLVFCLKAVDIWRTQEDQLSARQAVGKRGEDTLRTTLIDLGYHDWLDGIHVGDASRGAEIDLVLPGAGFLLVLEAKNWSGIVHGTKNDQDWFLEGADGNHRPRRNPINQASRQARLLAKQTGVPVASCCIMVGRSRPATPEGYPLGVVPLGELAEALPAMLACHPKKRRVDQAALRDAYAALQRSTSDATGQKAAEDYRTRMAAVFAPMPWLTPLAIAVLCAALAGFLEDGVLLEVQMVLGRFFFLS